MKTEKKHRHIRRRFIGFVAILVLCWVCGRLVTMDQREIMTWLEPYPAVVSGLLFVSLFAGLTFFVWFSKDILILAGGLIFGLTTSTFLVGIGEIINAVVLFWLSRRLGRGYVLAKTGGRFAGFYQRVEQMAMPDLLALRAVILVPFRFQDLGFGLTKISFQRYIFAVVIGSWPRVFIRQYFVLLAARFVKDGDITGLMGHIQAQPGILAFAWIYVIATAVLIWRLKKIVFPSRKRKD